MPGAGAANPRRAAEARLVLNSAAPVGSEDWGDGAGDRNRTRDLLITNQLLYLLSYASLKKLRPL